MVKNVYYYRNGGDRMKDRKLPKHDVICIDMKSFYASCECVYRGIDPMKEKLVVVGDINRNGSVVLASSPAMKKVHGIKTGSRLYEVKKIKDEHIIIAQARMGYYIEKSKEIREIFEEFVPPNQIHVYSVDESWLTLDGTKRLWGEPHEAAQKIIKRIEEKTGIVSAIGIGDNKFLAKCVLDNYAKKTGVAECRYRDVEKMIHPLPVQKMWGIGTQMTKHFNRLGIFTIGDLAHSDRDLIGQMFGKNGRILHDYAWGIDESPVFYDEENPPQSVFGFNLGDEKNPVKSVGRGVTLLSDYKDEKAIKLVIRELVEEVCEALRKSGKQGRTIHLSVGYSMRSTRDGFSRQRSIDGFTNDTIEIMDVCERLFQTFYRKGEAVRKLRVSVGNLTEQQEELIEDEKEIRRKTYQAIDGLNERFGKGTVMKASSLMKESVARERSKKIAGHYSGDKRDI